MGFPLYLRNALETTFFLVGPKRSCEGYLNSLKPCKGVLDCPYNMGKMNSRIG